MENQKNLILAIVLSVAIILVFQLVISPPKPTPPQNPTTTTQPQTPGTPGTAPGTRHPWPDHSRQVRSGAIVDIGRCRGQTRAARPERGLPGRNGDDITLEG